MARMWNDTQELAQWSDTEIVATIESAQLCQKTYSMRHPLNPIWSQAINEGCAEMAKRHPSKREGMAR
jgi:hypothetical protein